MGIGPLSECSTNFNLINANVSLPQLSDKGITRTESFITGLKRSLAPKRYAQTQNEVRRIELEGTFERAVYCKTIMPWLTDEQAYLVSNGHQVSADQAENIFAVLGKADKLIAESESAYNPEPTKKGGSFTSGFVGQVMDSIRNLDDDCMQDYWARLIKGEHDNPGAFSKRAMSILADMSRDDAIAFENISTFLVSTKMGENHPLGLVLVPDEKKGTYNNGLISFETLSNLQALGLFSDRVMYGEVAAGETTVFWCGENIDEPLCIRNEGADNKTLVFNRIQPTPYAEQLARLCGIGTERELRPYVDCLCERQGLTLLDKAETARIFGEKEL